VGLAISVESIYFNQAVPWSFWGFFPYVKQDSPWGLLKSGKEGQINLTAVS
jgi:hypothetical protein